MATVIYLGDKHGSHSNHSSCLERLVGTLVGYFGYVVVFWACLLVNAGTNLGAFSNYGLFQHF